MQNFTLLLLQVAQLSIFYIIPCKKLVLLLHYSSELDVLQYHQSDIWKVVFFYSTIHFFLFNSYSYFLQPILFKFYSEGKFKDYILLKYQIFHKIKLLFSGKVTKFFVDFNLNAKLQICFVLFLIQVFRLPIIHHKVQSLVQQTQNKQHVCCCCNICLKYFACT